MNTGQITTQLLLLRYSPLLSIACWILACREKSLTFSDYQKTQHKKTQHRKLNARKLNTRKLNTEKSTHFKPSIIVIYIIHVYSLLVLLIIYAFDTIFLECLCLRLDFFYRFVPWLLVVKRLLQMIWSWHFRYCFIL